MRRYLPTRRYTISVVQWFFFILGVYGTCRLLTAAWADDDDSAVFLSFGESLFVACIALLNALVVAYIENKVKDDIDETNLDRAVLADEDATSHGVLQIDRTKATR